MWKWHRDTDSGPQTAETESMTPPPGRGWTVVPGQVPAGRVQGGTGPTKMNRGTRAAKTRRGQYDGSGMGDVQVTAMKDDGRHLGNTITHHG